MIKQTPSARYAGIGTDDAAVEAIIELLCELIAIIEGENRLLTQGLPASLSEFVERKTQLSVAFEQWVEDIRAQKVQVSLANPRRRAHLIERTRALATITEENLARLRVAMDASQRRINAIMAAIREQVAQPGYGANGLHHTGLKTASVLGAQLKI